MMRNWVLCILLLISTGCFGQGRDTFDVLFPFSDARLSKSAAEHIDKLVFKDSLVHGQQFMILGYADYVGGDKYNDDLSAKRAACVKNYLTDMGFKASDISICVGKGKINRNGATGRAGVAADRKVQIIISPVQQKIIAASPTLTAPKPTPKTAAASKPAVLDIAHIAVNEAVTLRNILFVSAEAFILPSSVPELEVLYNFMNVNGGVKIRIEGHTCCLGIVTLRDANDPDGNILSMDRAKAVSNYLVKKGIAQERITCAGFGNTRPVAGSVTPEDQQKNRRVEIRIISK
jgi:outer membrane protein OmpA-like peptidoglycan-associated protein